MTKQKTVTKEFEAEAVRLARTGGETRRQTADNLSAGLSTLTPDKSEMTQNETPGLHWDCTLPFLDSFRSHSAPSFQQFSLHWWLILGSPRIGLADSYSSECATKSMT